MVGRIFVLLLAVVVLGGCSGIDEYQHRSFWKGAHLVYEDGEEFGYWDPSIDPGDSIVLYICDGGVPTKDNYATDQAYSTCYTLEIPGDARVGDVIDLHGADGTIVFEQFPGIGWRILDRESPATATVKILGMDEDRIRARVDIRLTSVSWYHRVPRDRRYPDQVHYRGTDLFTRVTEYREGSGRHGRLYREEREARKRADEEEAPIR